MNADDDKHSAPIPIASCGPSHHVRSFSLSFASPNPPSLSASSLSSYSPTSPSPILAQTLPSFFSTSPNTAAANGLAASMSPSSGRPICGFASGKDWASAAAWAGGSAVEEEDEVEESSGVRIVAPAGSGSSLGVMGWQGKAMAPKAPAPPVVSGGSAGKSVGMATEKGAGLMRRLSLGGGGLFRVSLGSFAYRPLPGKMYADRCALFLLQAQRSANLSSSPRVRFDSHDDLQERRWFRRPSLLFLLWH
jgi:hypothetical protein